MVYIPGFLINKVYEQGSLCNIEGGFEFRFLNTMTPLQISGMRDIKIDVDGMNYPVEKLSMILGDTPIDLSGSDEQGILKFDRSSPLIIRIAGAPLGEGKHVLRVGLITNEYGGATLKVSDVIGSPQKVSLWEKAKRLISGQPAAESGAPRAGPSEPLFIEGELGGVPLDPDFSRLEAAIRHEEADRVPLFEAEIAMPIQEWFIGRPIEKIEDEVEFYIRAGYDYVPVTPPFFTPRLMRTAAIGDGDLSDDDLERAWLTESEGIIKTMADVEKFPWPKAEEVDFTSFHEIAALLPPKMKTLGVLVPAAVFGNTSQSMGLENFSYALWDDPKLVAALFEIIGSSYLQIAKRLVTVPRVGAVFLCDDLAHGGGPLVSPKIYREYVFPWYKKIGETLANADLPFLFHSDGNLWEVLDDLVDCGVKGVHPVEPQAMDIVDLKKRYGDRLCIFGNIDLDYTLTRGTVEEVEQLVIQRLKALAPGGGYGLAASNSIPDYVIPENYRAMVEAAKKYGKYPIAI